MKSRTSLRYLWACAAVVLLAASRVCAQVDIGPVTATGSAEVGAYPQPLPYTQVAKFQEYSDFAQQVIAPHLRLLLGGKEQEYYAKFDLVNVAQKNELYTLRTGKYGVLDIQAQWQEIPHFFSNGVAESPYQRSGGTFSLVNRPSAPTPGQPSGENVRTWVDANARPLTLSLLEGIANLHVSYTPTSEWTFTADYNFQNPTGDGRAWGAMFGPNPGAYNITELYQPIQYYTYNYGVGAQYAKDGWVGGIKYQGSFFENQYDTLTWDNPNTWDEMTGPGGSCQNSGLYPGPDNGLGPCRGEMSMYPDNQAHNLTIDGGGVLPFHTHVMASASYGFWLQNAPFIPYTINSALPQVPLPRQSLRGDVQPFFVNATFVSDPIERLELRGTYSYYDYNNQTPPMVFTNVPTLNDVASLWSATAYPFSFSDQDINLTASYNLTHDLAARFIGDISTYHNSGLMVLQQDQTTYGPVIDWTPYTWLELRGSYQYAFRDSPGYNNNRTSLVNQNAGLTEVDALRRFDEATVHVNQANLYMQVQPRKDTTFYAEFDYDDYYFPASDLGLQHSSDYSPSVGATWNPFPNTHFYVDYSWQAEDWNMASMQRQTHAPIPSQPACPNTIAEAQTPENCPGQVWTSYGRDQGSSVDLGMDIDFPANQFLKHESHLQIMYTYAVGTSLIHANGDAALNPATDFPNVGSQFHQLIVQYAYQVRKHSWVKFGYFFNHFGYNNFAIDNATQWMSSSPNSMFLGDSTETPYNANVGYVSFKQTF
jgi:MtrB/PioB family decaheme-associated outer membrane protein